MPNNQTNAVGIILLSSILTVFIASAIDPSLANANYRQSQSQPQYQQPCNR